MQQLREEHNEALNATKDNNTTETIEEHDKLHQTIEEDFSSFSWYFWRS